MLRPYEATIEQWLREDQERRPKQRHTAHRIWERLCAERGFTGAESTVRRHVGWRRRELGLTVKEVYIEQDPQPGEEAQVDFGEADIVLGGVLTRVYLLLVRCCYSGCTQVMAFRRQTQQCFLEGLATALSRFGGVFERLRFDNLSAAVKNVLRGRTRKETDRFVALRSHYLRRSSAVQARKGRTRRAGSKARWVASAAPGTDSRGRGHGGVQRVPPTCSAALWFLPTVPSTEVIEQATLGFGRFTAEWFERRPAPDGDGEVLVILIDSKGVPTATLRELRKRRGKRRKAKVPKSARHRGRQRRARWSPKQRRNKGDKSKNAKMATLVVMYTLKRQGNHLVGPINRWVYGSFAPKKHAFIIARREANKRGFTPGSGKQIQLLTDGDPDLALYGKDLFPEATHTLDVIHVVEKLWDAGACIHKEGSDALKDWVAQQKQRLYGGRVTAIIGELVSRWEAIPKTGPGNKGKRKRLEEIIGT